MIRYRFVFARKKPIKIGDGRTSDYLKNLFLDIFPVVEDKKGRFSFGPSLPLDFESESEYVDVYMKYRMEESVVKDLIEKNISEHYTILRFKTIPLYFPSVESVLDALEYEFYIDRDIDDEFFVDEKRFKSKDIFDFRIKKSSFSIILSKNVKISDFISFFDDYKFLRKIRKNLYWIDSNGNLRII
jgi:hypothetical protein